MEIRYKKTRARQPLLRDKIIGIKHDYCPVSYFDFTSDRIGYCNSYFNFILGLWFEI